MNWDRIEGNWKQLKGKAREQWGERTDTGLHVIAAKREQLVGAIREKYGIAKDDAKRQVKEWERRGERVFDMSARRTNKLLEHLGL